MKRRSSNYLRNLLLLILGLAVIGVVITVLWLAYSNAMTLVHPARTQPEQTPADYGIQAWEEVSFSSQGGLQLAGWFIPPAQNKDGATIIYVHGLGSNRGDLLEQAALLSKQGYGALLFDLRNHGQSQGEITTLGYVESEDVRAAVDYLLTRADVNPQRIGLVGMSMGGATVIRAAAHIPEIRAVIAEAAFTSIEDNLAHGVRALTGLSPFPFAPLVAWFGEQEADMDMQLMRPIDEISQIAPRPILLIHGDQDLTVPVENSLALYQAAGEPKQLYIVKNAGHGGFLETDPQGFTLQLENFFEQNLLQP
jgi:fermentation-respiration switch protein FrsA (DUF1100 family)